MRIGLFTDSYAPYINGVSTSVENLRNALIKLGHTVYVVTLNDSLLKHTYDDNEKILRMPGIPTRIYNYRLSNIYSMSALRIIKKWDLDIIHSHTEFGIGIFARIVAKKYKIPLVHTYHTLYEDYTHYITHGHFNNTSKKLVKKLTKIYCEKTAEHTIVPTDKIYNLFKEKYNITKNISVIPTGINVSKFFKENISMEEVEKIKKRYNINKKDFVILFVGRLAQEKNIEFLLECQKKLIETSKKKSFKLLIVGDGPDKEKYIAKAKKLGISKNVIFTGSIPQDSIQYYYHCAKIFATASTTETQGLTVIEAIASNLIPLCINDLAFIKILPKDCIFNNEEDYIEKVKRIEKYRFLYNKCGKELKEVMNKYSYNTYAKNVLEIYETVISNYKEKKEIKASEH